MIEEHKISAIIVDDERLGRELILEYCKKRDDVIIVAECRDAHEAFEAIERHVPDLVFLDIQMPQIDGFELLDMLESKPYVIFSTAYDQYAIRAFEVNATDYLLKPYDEQRFNTSLDRAIHRIRSQANQDEIIERIVASVKQQDDRFLKRLLIKQSGKILIISIDEVEWIEAMDDYVNIRTKSDSYLLQQSMSKLEASLDPNQFIRAHRSYIVNIDFIKEIATCARGGHKLTMKDGKEIGLSRTGTNKLKRFSI